MHRFAARIAAVSLAATLLLSTSAAPVQADVTVAQSMVQVTPSDGLNLRQSPSLDSAILAVLPVGTQLHLLQTQGEWEQVVTRTGTVGWVNSAWTAPVHATGEVLQPDVAPVIVQGTTLVPVRALAEWLGAKVQFDPGTSSVLAQGRGHTLALPLNSHTAKVDGSDKALTLPAIVFHGRTLVPLRFFAEAFGVNVTWFSATQEIRLEADGRVATVAVPPAPAGVQAALADALNPSGRADVSRSGTSARRVRATMEMVATGYAVGQADVPSDTTATGVPAKHGVVAVDPAVIPLGTRLYIEGYGEAVAADTGGAIKGNRIDLCFDTGAEADAFGLRKITVEILEP